MSKHNWLWNIYIYSYINIWMRYSEQPDQQPTRKPQALRIRKASSWHVYMGADDVP